MAAGLTEDIELDISDALRDVDKLEAALESTARAFKVEIAKALDLLRGDASTIELRVDDKGQIKRAAREINDVEQETRQAAKASNELSSSWDGVRRVVGSALSALGTRFVVNEIGAMIDASSDLAESQSKVTVVFGESAAEIEAWGETSAEAVGLSKQQAFEAAGTFGNLFTALGLSRDAAAGLSPEVVQLGADFASFNNLEVPDTLEKLRSGLVGEIEPLRSLGISFNAAQVEAKALELGLAGANGEISEGAKVQARWALIVEQSTAAQGDFARTSDGLANQQRILQAELGNARAELGERLLPAMLKAVEVGRGFLDFFLGLPEPVQNLALGFAALGIALGPFVLAVGNLAKVGSTAVSAVQKILTSIGSANAAGLVMGASVVTAIVGIGVAAAASAESIDSKLRRAMQSLSEESTPKLIERFAEAGNSLEAFEFIAQENLAAAIRLRDGLREQGEETAQLDVIVKQHTSSQQELAADTAAAEAAITGETSAIQGATTATAEAVTPSERLAEAAFTLSDGAASASDKIDALSDALDAALGVYLSSETATIRVRQAVTDLTTAFGEGQKEGESLQAFQDRLTLATHDVTQAVLDEVEALTRDGTISGEAAAQKEAITSRLLHLADTLGGPMAVELREHAERVEKIPDEAVTTVTADTKAAEDSLSALATIARVLGVDVANEFTAGIVAGLRDPANQGRVTASADSIAATVENAAARRLGIESPSKVGESIGGEFVNGVVLGLDKTAVLAEQQSVALASGLEEVWRQAATITVEEQLEIFAALDQVHAAQEKLDALRKDSKATAEDLWRAELEVAAAQQHVNDVVFAARDASAALTAEMEKQKEAAEELRDTLDDVRSAYDAVAGVRDAASSTAEIEARLDELRAEQRASHAELLAARDEVDRLRAEAAAITPEEELGILRAEDRERAAQAALDAARAEGATSDELRRLELELQLAVEATAQAKRDAIGPTRELADAESRLAEVQEERRTRREEIAQLERDLVDARLEQVDATVELIDAGGELFDSEGDWETFFRTIAEMAGLSEDAIDDLVAVLQNVVTEAGAAAAAVASLTGVGAGATLTPVQPLTPSATAKSATTSSSAGRVVQLGPNYVSQDVDVDTLLQRGSFALAAGRLGDA